MSSWELSKAPVEMKSLPLQADGAVWFSDIHTRLGLLQKAEEPLFGESFFIYLRLRQIH